VCGLSVKIVDFGVSAFLFDNKNLNS